MKKLYVVGNLSSKSLSPLIFNYWFKKYKINAQYNFIETNKKKFKKEIKKTLKQKDLLGLNITTPFKQNILSFVDSFDVHSQSIKAVNCVVLKKGKIKGINTDWIGYKKSLQKYKLKKNDTVLILGYGGAAMAIYYSFLKDGFKKIFVFNRTKKLIKYKNTKKFTKNIKDLNQYLSSASLIINTTPTNILKEKQQKMIKRKVLISDIVYAPKNTNFLNLFKGNKKIYGISMLLNQAVPCFKEWFGFEPLIDKKLLTKLNKQIT